MTFICCLAVSCLSLASCDSELDVQQEYPFTVESMPVVGKIADGETVEIRLEIKAEGNFSGTVYTLRYFQPDGTGLKLNDLEVFNDLRLRWYYSSQSADASQTIDLYFEDNWGNLQRLSYDFNADDTPLAEKDDTHGKEVQP